MQEAKRTTEKQHRNIKRVVSMLSVLSILPALPIPLDSSTDRKIDWDQLDILSPSLRIYPYHIDPGHQRDGPGPPFLLASRGSERTQSFMTELTSWKGT